MSAGRTVCRLRIRGQVQGVGYRFAFADRARAAGIDGWVANRHDGSVAAVIAGAADDVEAMCAWARQGPSSARVASVEIEPAEGDFDGFQIAKSF